MGFDQSNYVQNNGDGTYTAVVNGKPVADNNGNTSFKDLNFTQQAFNANYGGGQPSTSTPTPSNPTPSGTPASGGGSSASSNNYGNPYGDGATYYGGTWHAPSAGGATAPAGSMPSAFNGQNFVGQQGNGYVAYGGGHQLGSFPTQVAAEQAYNAYFNQPNPTAPNATGNALSTGVANGTQTGIPGPVDMNKTYSTVNGTLPFSAILAQINQAAGYQKYDPATADPNVVLADYNQTATNGPLLGQEAGYSKNLQNEAATKQATAQATMADRLLQSLSGPEGPGMIPTINAALQALGLPALPNSASQGKEGLIPNGITPAMWDQMSPTAQQMILLAWQARGGDPKDFLAGIDAQRPQGSPGLGARVDYAPLVA